MDVLVSCLTEGKKIIERVKLNGRDTGSSGPTDECLTLLVIGPRGIPDSEGGVEKYATAVLPRLQGLGFAVTVACMRRFTSLKEYRGVRVVRIATYKALMTDKHLYLIGAIALAVRTRPRRILILGTAAATLIIPLRMLGFKVYARCGLFDQHTKKWGHLARLFIHGANLQLRLANGVIAVSRDIAQQLRGGLGVSNVAVIPNGRDEVESAAPSVLPRPSPYVLAVGRVTLQKDYLTLLRAFKRAAVPGLRLVIAGASDGSLSRAELAEFEHPAVDWLGFVGRQELNALYGGAVLYVNASIIEGMSNAVLEAISHQRPILLSDIPANREVAAQPISYFPVGDDATLATKLVQAVTEPKAFVADLWQVPDWDAVAAITAAFLATGHSPQDSAL